MNGSKLTLPCGVALALALAVAVSARAQDIGYRSTGAACAGCILNVGGLTSVGTILDARWDGTYVLTAVTHDARSLRIVKKLDAASPKLQEAFSKGMPFPEVKLTVPKEEGSQEYLEIKLKPVYITSYQTGGSQDRPTESITMTFQKLEISYKPQKTPAAGPVKAEYDLEKIEKAAPEQPGLVAAVADLLPLNSLTVGPKVIPWGQTVTISPDDSSYKQGGRCFFRYLYRTGNLGQAGAGPTTNRIHLDAANGPSLADDALPALAAGDEHTASGLLPLVPGTWTLYVHVDDDLVVAEGDEQNNLRRVRVRVEGSCR